MARVDEAPEDRHTETVKVEQNVDCPKCDTMFDVTIDTGEYDVEMIDDADNLKTVAVCPACGHTWTQQYDGWSHHTDAG